MAVNREAIMAKCLEEISSKYPASTIGRYSEIGSKVNIDTITTGSLAADYVLGGGISRMCEIVGYPSTGKTTLAFTAIACLQREKPDANILYVDAEYTVDPSYAVALGVDMEKVILLQPEDTISGYNIIEMFIQSGVADLVVLDSIAAMIPPEYTEKEIGDTVQIASFARLTTQAIARINRLSAQYDCKIIFINQYKDAVSANGMSGGSGTVMGNSAKYAPGGPSKDFYFQQILETKRVRQIKGEDKNIKSNVYGIKTLKNKVAPPYRSGEIVITFGKGLDLVQELFGLATTYGIIAGSGFYKIQNPETGEQLIEKPIRGQQAVIDFLEENQDIYEQIRELVKEKLDSLIDDGKNNKVKIGDIDSHDEE